MSKRSVVTYLICPECDENVSVSFSLSCYGGYLPATQHEPAEYPEYEISDVVITDRDCARPNPDFDHCHWEPPVDQDGLQEFVWGAEIAGEYKSLNDMHESYLDKYFD